MGSGKIYRNLVKDLVEETEEDLKKTKQNAKKMFK